MKIKEVFEILDRKPTPPKDLDTFKAFFYIILLIFIDRNDVFMNIIINRLLYY